MWSSKEGLSPKQKNLYLMELNILKVPEVAKNSFSQKNSGRVFACWPNHKVEFGGKILASGLIIIFHWNVRLDQASVSLAGHLLTSLSWHSKHAGWWAVPGSNSWQEFLESLFTGWLHNILTSLHG